MRTASWDQELSNPAIDAAPLFVAESRATTCAAIARRTEVIAYLNPEFSDLSLKPLANRMKIEKCSQVS